MASRENLVVRLLENIQTKANAPSFSPRCPSDLCSLQFRADRQTPVTAEEEADTVMECILKGAGVKKQQKEEEKEGKMEWKHTYLHMDHTSQRDTKSQSSSLFFAPLWSKSYNSAPSPSYKHSSVPGQTQQATERQKERHRERDYKCHLS